MGMQIRVSTVRVLTVLGWLTVIADASPGGRWISFEDARLGLVVAVVGSVSLLLRRHALPVVQLYEAGKEAGRKEAEMDPRPRHLHVVDN